LDVVKWGSKSGHQRFKCNICKKTYVRARADITARNRLAWFREWVEDGHTIGYISKRSGYSVRTLKNYFYDYLRDYPVWHIRPAEKVNLLIDGTYFTNKVCLVLYQDNNVKATQLYRLTDDEWQGEIMEDLNNLISLGIRIESVTCDGAAGIIKAVRKCAPKAIVQRCTVHVQRECLIWLTRNPKSEAGRELRAIVSRLNSIEDRDQWGWWVVSLIRWEEKHREYLNQKTVPDDDPCRGWFTHKMVRKSFVHIRRALPDLFHYLDNPAIPKSTNSLESFFGHLKTNLRLHRGLSKEHFKNYVKWYLFFKNNKFKYKK
jgi:hypothetical protein